MLRNFYIETMIDGRSKKLEGGPVGRYGGMTTDLFIKDEKAISIKCFELKDKLYLTVQNNLKPEQQISMEIEK